MDINDFLLKFSEQFDDTDASEIEVGTCFQDLDEWGSLMLITIIAFAKTTYDKTINGKEIRSCETVQDLYNLISSK